jgi:glutamyl/glutaminyl-tRNA synthetase
MLHNDLHIFQQTIGPDSRLRLAPTPSGFLHAGNILNFRLNHESARQKGANLLLRIDDLDADRKRTEYVDNIFETLQKCGIDYDEGPRDTDDFEKNWSQHHRIRLYHSLLDRLRALGLLFACRKSRTDLKPFNGQYPPEFREQGLELDMPDVAWRIKTPEGFPMPDFVVRRRDGIPAYQVASVADDLHWRITHIIRGADLEPSTMAQLFLADCLGEQRFTAIHFYHHPLLLDEKGEKISKSAGNAIRSIN